MGNLLEMSRGWCEISFHSSSRQHPKYKIGVRDFGGTFLKYFLVVVKRSLMINVNSWKLPTSRMVSNIHFLLTSALSHLWSSRSTVHRDFCSLFYRKMIWDRIGRRRRPPAFGRAVDTICLSICALFPIDDDMKSLETPSPWILQRRIHQCL